MEALATAAMMQNVDVSTQVVLSLAGDFQRTTHTYQCDGLDPLTVEFINAEPNFLAIVPIGGRKMVFANVIAASGARYAAGQFEFWTKGAEATLTDLQADPQTPISCTEATETP